MDMNALGLSAFGGAIAADVAGVAAITAGVVLLATDGSAPPRAGCAANVTPAGPSDPQAVESVRRKANKMAARRRMLLPGRVAVGSSPRRISPHGQGWTAHRPPLTA